MLNGKTALVTGGSRGIGRAIALALGKAGAAVAVTDLLIESDNGIAEEPGESGLLAEYFSKTGQVATRATAGDIEKMGGRSLALKMDVTKSDEIKAAVEKATDLFGGIDILVNNAGLLENMALMEDQSPEFWERDLNVNLTGNFLCSKAVWPGMVERQWGRIINISSIAGKMGAFTQPSYGASKAGLIGLTRSLALEGALHGITVNTVLPGFIETEAVRLVDERRLEKYRARSALKRLGRPEEVAALVVFLASDASGYMTGTAIPVAGGADLLVL